MNSASTTGGRHGWRSPSGGETRRLGRALTASALAARHARRRDRMVIKHTLMTTAGRRCRPRPSAGAGARGRSTPSSRGRSKTAEPTWAWRHMSRRSYAASCRLRVFPMRGLSPTGNRGCISRFAADHSRWRSAPQMNHSDGQESKDVSGGSRTRAIWIQISGGGGGGAEAPIALAEQ